MSGPSRDAIVIRLHSTDQARRALVRCGYRNSARKLRQLIGSCAAADLLERLADELTSGATVEVPPADSSSFQSSVPDAADSFDDAATSPGPVEDDDTVVCDPWEARTAW